jgi:very-short-patch-repair endonuclease
MIGRGSIAHRVESGRLHRIHPGVYAVGHSLLSLNGKYMAATLAAGEGAVLGHRSAADLHGLLADVAQQRHVERALHQAEILRAFDLAALEDAVARANGRRTKVLRAALEQHRHAPAFTPSELEEAFLALVDAAGLPRPRTNTHVCGHAVDAYWPDLGLVVELDSFKYHRTRARFESDRRRDIALQAAGLRTVRFTDRRIAHEPEAIAHDLRRLVDSRPSRSS